MDNITGQYHGWPCHGWPSLSRLEHVRFHISHISLCSLLVRGLKERSIVFVVARSALTRGNAPAAHPSHRSARPRAPSPPPTPPSLHIASRATTTTRSTERRARAGVRRLSRATQRLRCDRRERLDRRRAGQPSRVRGELRARRQRAPPPRRVRAHDGPRRRGVLREPCGPGRAARRGGRAGLGLARRPLLRRRGGRARGGRAARTRRRAACGRRR